MVPNFHNPTGASLSAARARLLAGLADRYGFLLRGGRPLRGDPFRRAGAAAAAEPDRPVRVGGDDLQGALPRTAGGLAGGPGTGWPRRSTLLKQAVDLHTSTLAQRIALRLLERPDFDRRIGVLRDHYRGQAAVLVEALAGRLR